ncbi:hypothetical protein M758_UG024600 [Ceratodon purpureus]|nr:hypothetical protein M758_UG024600 [Ceratodon purpureus]
MLIRRSYIYLNKNTLVSNTSSYPTPLYIQKCTLQPPTQNVYTCAINSAIPVPANPCSSEVEKNCYHPRYLMYRCAILQVLKNRFLLPDVSLHTVFTGHCSCRNRIGFATTSQ